MIPVKLTKRKSVLVIAAHPDDEVLGCGATMARHVARGDSVHVMILAEGITGRNMKRSQPRESNALTALSKCAKNANKILGVTSLVLERYPDNRLDSIDRLDIIKTIENRIAKIKPRVVYTHHGGDLNIDHRRVHEAVITACRPLPGYQTKEILFFEIPSSTEWQIPSHGNAFIPNWFVDVSNTLTLKLRALNAYAPELRAYPHPRSLQAVEHLARWRGASIGVQAAEAFMLGRKLVD